MSRYLSHPLLLICLGCAPAYPNDAIIFEGDNLRYISTTDRPVCSGSFSTQDRFVARLAEHLSFTLNSTIDYAYVPFEDAESFCMTASALGCRYGDNSVTSSQTFHFHELVHAVAFQAGYIGPSPFQEGFAELYGRQESLDSPAIDISDVLRNFSPSEEAYYTMAHFEHFLIQEYGLDLLLTFMARTEYDDLYEDFAPVFQEVYGVSLDELAASYTEKYPHCSRRENGIDVLTCMSTPEPSESSTSWDLDVDVSCNAEDVMGPDQGDYIKAERVIEITEPGVYIFWPNATEVSESTPNIRLTRCGSCLDTQLALIPQDEMRDVYLTPGRYVLEFPRLRSKPAPIHLSIFLLGNW